MTSIYFKKSNHGTVNKMGNNWILIFCASFLMWNYCQAQDVTYHVTEESRNSTLIGNVGNDSNLFSAIGGNDASNLIFSFLTTGNQYAHYFRVDEKTSDLYTNGVIDREKVCEFSDSCLLLIQLAAKSNLGSFFRILKIQIIIDDVNDHSPVFEQNSLTLPISEAVLVGTSFSINGARDKDASAKYSLKTYEMESAGSELTSELPFSIQFVKHLDGSSPINLIVTQHLDHEVKDFYDIVIIAKDGDNPPRTSQLSVRIIVEDENDNPPVFTSSTYNGFINGETEVGDSVLWVSASDKDSGENGHVRYRLSQNQAEEIRQQFSVNINTGDLTLASPIVLTPGKVFNIIVEAYDNPDDGQESTAQALVTVTVENTGNTPPQIKVNLIGLARVSEQANLGKVVAYVKVTDHDEGKQGLTSCIIETDHNNFALRGIKDTGNEYTVVVSSKLDYEIRPKQNVTINCMDRGSPSLKSSKSFVVTVLDENDNAPIFTEFIFSSHVPEDAQIGDYIMEVSAIDRDSGKNAELRFEVSSDYKNYFYIINSTSKANVGNLRLNKTLDREKKSMYEFKVYAFDGGHPSKTGSATVKLYVTDVNDEHPKFTQTPFKLYVLENLPPDSIVGTVTAIDLDVGINKQIYYSMDRLYAGKVPFIVSPNGMIKTTQQLDREAQSRYEFRVIATDSGDNPLSGTGTVIVTVSDDNDMDPVMEFPQVGNNSITIPATSEAWGIVTRAIAHDDDEVGTSNSKLRYSIHKRNDSVEQQVYIFQINPNTGEVQLTRNLDDSYIGKVFLLDVQASDYGSQTSRAAVVPLYITIGAGNITHAQTSSDTLSSQNFLIAVIVGVVTVVLSIGILATICIIRKIDRERKHDESPKEVQNAAESQHAFDGSITVFSLPSEDSLVNEKKKKEVSFSLEDDVFSDDDLLQKNGVDHNNRHFKNLTFLSPGSKKVEDNHSETSGDTGTSDSGRGGSDEEIHNMSVSQSPRDKMLSTIDISRQIPPLSHQEIIPFSFKKGLPMQLHNDLDRPNLFHSDLHPKREEYELTRRDIDSYKHGGMPTMAIHLHNNSLERSRNKVVLLQTDSGIHSDTNSNDGELVRDSMI